MKSLSKSIAKIQRDIQTARVGSRNIQASGTSNIDSIGAKISDLNIKTKIHMNIDLNSVPFVDTELVTSRMTRKASMDLDGSINLNSSRLATIRNTQVVRKDYFK